MAVIRPFPALRPDPVAAPRVAAVPYDVVDTDEARALAAGNPLSFLHVSRPEIDLPIGVDPHDDSVYRHAADRFSLLRRDAPLVRENAASFYLYHLDSEGHGQTGVAACFSLAEYDSNIIKKHERTRQDKEDDRTRHMLALRAQTGPAFLLHRPSAAIAHVTGRVRSTTVPLVDFAASDGVRHTVWRVDSRDEPALASAFAQITALYIADGHHRVASAARSRDARPDSRDAAVFLGVAFPSDQVRILPYNRTVRDLGGMTPESFVAEVARRFAVTPGSAHPGQKGRVSMYVAGLWYSVDLASGGRPGAGAIDGLDCNMLQERLLKPVLDIGDIRTDTRIDFVGGARGTATLEQRVDLGTAAVAFSLYPVSVSELMDVSDAGAIMPPKSTWFEPKLRDGLLIHEI